MKGGTGAPQRRGQETELTGTGRQWRSLRFPVHKVKWTLPCSIAREVTSPHRFLSSPSDLQLQIPPDQGFPHVMRILRFKEFGTDHLSDGELELQKRSALDKLTHSDCHL